VIASGPTVADPTTLADARAVLQRFGITPDAAVQQALQDPANESCKAGDPALANARFSLIARPRDALDSAIAAARSAGFETMDLGELEGEAREVATAHAQLARDAHVARRKLAILSGGELTVTVRGRGRGGPNQEYVLALSSALRDLDRVAVLAADTDGADGGGGAPTDPAGAFFDAQTLRRTQDAGLDPDAYLANNDATAFFEATGDLLTTGPTLTNVNDVRVILIDPE
jgi:hydroxypyruvate reductase